MGVHQTKKSQDHAAVQIDHPFFHNAKLVKQRNRTLMSISLPIEDKQYEKWERILMTNVKTAPQYLLLPQQHNFATRGLCGSTGFADISYEQFPYILMSQIQHRQRHKSTFQQAQLWFLLLSLSRAQTEMNTTFFTRVGDIRPHNVFLSSEGEIRVACVQSWPGERSNFAKAIEREEVYLAPQELTKLQLGGNDDLGNFATQIFSIGLTMLSAGMLKDFGLVYNIKKMTFDYEQFSKILDQWKANTDYSQIFTAIILNLLSYDMQKRLNPTQLQTFISTYQTQIKSKNNFIIKNVPIKIQTAIQQLRAYKSVIRSQYQNRNGSVYHQSEVLQRVMPYYKGASYSGVHEKQNGMSPIVQKRVSSPVLTFNGVVKQINPVMTRNIYPVIHQNIKLPEQSHNQSSKQIQQLVEQPEPIQLTHAQINNNNINQSQQVQTFFTPPQSILSQNDGSTSQNGGNFVYTRRIINVDTNSLLEQENIDQNQYYQGIRTKTATEDYQQIS